MMYGRIRFVTCAVLATFALAGAAPLLAQDEAPAVVTEPVYMGKPITLDVQEAEIGTVLRSLASFSGTNIVASPRVAGKVTVKLDEVPWREALAVILRAHSFDYIEEHGIIRIDTADELRQEKLEAERARKQVEDLEQLVLGMTTLRFANAEEVKDALEKMLTERGNIDVDERTNSLIVNDTEARVALITDMAKQLDTQTPQVEINARLVDMDSRATRELGVNWTLSNFNSPGNNLSGALDVTNPVQNAASDLRIGTVQDWGELMMQVQALENDNKAQLISNPVITTTDNREAKILVGQKIPLIVSDEAGNAITQLTTIGIMLQVTPHINSENRITLDIHNEVSDLSSQATVQGGVIINTSESDTRVLVENGETAIIAGLIRKVDSRLDTGIPVLQDIPLLGSLFRHSTDVKVDRELVVFVTPTIVTDEYMKRSQLTTEAVAEYTPEPISTYTPK
jgi:type IV pilus assembly protein PilQ